jgi:DNA-binding CsgD family transcriptional regulator
MSRFTVRDYVKAMREKTGFRSRTELAVKARQSGLVILEPNPEDSSKKPE